MEIDRFEYAKGLKDKTNEALVELLKSGRAVYVPTANKDEAKSLIA